MGIVLDLVDSFADSVDEYLLYLKHCEAALRDLQQLTDAIDFVVELLALQAPDIPISLQERYKKESIFIHQRLCHQRLQNVRRHIERFNHSFEGQNKTLNIQEFISVKRLMVLASIFIPLSLSASLWQNWEATEIRSERFIDRCLLVWIVILLVSIWSVILVSFIVGMTKETMLGLKILGYGLAGVLAYVIMAGIILATTTRALSLALP